MRPDFGCGLHDLVFSVGNATTEGLVADEIRRSLTLGAAPRPGRRAGRRRPGACRRLLVRIAYRVRATNNVFNLVYPFYLERGET